jgi:hypothetical protein
VVDGLAALAGGYLGIGLGNALGHIILAVQASLRKRAGR